MPACERGASRGRYVERREQIHRTRIALRLRLPMRRRAILSEGTEVTVSRDTSGYAPVARGWVVEGTRSYWMGAVTRRRLVMRVRSYGASEWIIWTGPVRG